MTLNFATALLLYLGAQALLREPQLHTHEKLKCFLHVLTVLNSQVGSLDCHASCSVQKPRALGLLGVLVLSASFLAVTHIRS